MNRLQTSHRAQILGMLVEGMSMRAITRLTGVSINTVAKLLSDAGEACAAFHDSHVRGIEGHRHIQCDEIWSFVYAKEKNAARAKAAPSNARDAWTWTAIDAQSKLIISYLMSSRRDGQSAIEFMDDLRSRIEDRPQITTDGLGSYIEAVEGAFGGDVDYAQLIKLYGEPTGQKGHERKYSPSECTGTRKRRVEGNPDIGHVSTSHVERQNFDHANGNAPVHAPNKCFQQAHRKAGGDAPPLLCSLQLLPGPQNAACNASHGSWPRLYGSRL